MSSRMNIRLFYQLPKNQTGYSLCLNEMRSTSLYCAPTGPRLRASKITPGDFVRKNMAANLERSPLTHNYGYGSAGDSPTLFARFPLSFVPFMQYSG